ncbi:response regulator [Deinococcus sp.]|uniref:response regulator n=1 Tax=Deinococcus sp. TaxID=47478 RepID=UPI003B59FD04
MSLMPPRSAPTFALLLVEDEPADAQIFTELLGDMTDQITVYHVSNGQEALDFLSRGSAYAHAPRPELIVLDLNMPVMSGLEFLRRAKIDEQMRAIPVMVLSTSEHPRDIQGAYHNYANGYVVKPGNIAEYQALLEKVTAYWNGAVRLPLIEDVAL